jgi:hypothetical protein
MASAAIAKAYVRRIRREEITIDDVPAQIRELVEELLEQNVEAYKTSK